MTHLGAGDDDLRRTDQMEEAQPRHRRDALAEAQADGRLQPGNLVLMTGMGAGLTWGSALMKWTLTT